MTNLKVKDKPYDASLEPPRARTRKEEDMLGGTMLLLGFFLGSGFGALVTGALVAIF